MLSKAKLRVDVIIIFVCIDCKELADDGVHLQEVGEGTFSLPAGGKLKVARRKCARKPLSLSQGRTTTV